MAQRKKGMSGMDLLCMEQELQFLVDGYFNKAYQPTRGEVLLSFRAPGRGRVDVAIGVGDYLTITEKDRDLPDDVPQFATQLRKHLTGGKVLGIHQHAFDRIIVFEIGKSEGVYQLIAEVFHKGNMVLVKDDEILYPLIHTEWSSRVIRPGREWRFPPIGFNPKDTTEPRFIETLRESDADMIRTLSTVGNLGPLWAEEVCTQAGVAKELAIEDATSDQLARVARTTLDLIQTVRDEPDPVAYPDEDGEWIDAAPIPLESYGDRETERVDHLWQALDEVFAPRKVQEGAQDERLKKIENLRGKYERQVEDISERLARFQDEEERHRQAGDLLYAHFNDVDQLLKRCQELHTETGWGPLFEEPPEEGQVKVAKPMPEDGSLLLTMPDSQGQMHEIKVRLKKSLGANAEIHYERSKEMREKQDGAKKALAKAKHQLKEVDERGDELLEQIEKEEAKPDPTHRFWFDKFRWFISSDGNIVAAGRDARSNERIVKKYLEDSDRYVHANLQGAPSVVVKARDNEEIPETTLEEAAQFAIAYSKAWRQAVGRGQAYWVTPPQVSKTPETGEYVPHGSFIIRGERNYIRAETRCGIGETHVDGHRKVMGGPPSAIEARCDRYVLFEPGRAETGPLSSLLSDVFEVPVEEIQAALPPGPVRIVDSMGISEEILDGVQG